MYNPEATKLLVVVFFCMLAAIAGGMMLMPGDKMLEPGDDIARYLIDGTQAKRPGKFADTSKDIAIDYN